MTISLAIACLMIGLIIGGNYAISIEKRYIKRDVQEYLKIRTFLEYEIEINYNFFKKEYTVIAKSESETATDQKIVLSVKDRNKPNIWDMTEINGEEEISEH